MGKCKWVLILLLFFMSHKEIQCTTNPALFIWKTVQQHPFITAAIIIIAMQEEPWVCIKDIVRSFIEDHPIISIIVLGVFLSGMYKEFFYVLKMSCKGACFIFRSYEKFLSCFRHFILCKN